MSAQTCACALMLIDRIVLLVVGSLVLGGCGDDGESDDPTAGGGKRREDGYGRAGRSADRHRDEHHIETGTLIVAGDSQFGRMLFDARRRAISIFELDADP